MKNISKQKLIFSLIALGVLAIIIVPALIGIVGGISSVYRKNQDNPLTLSGENWQEYKNEEKGFSFFYPPEMYVAGVPFSGFTTTLLLNDLKEVALPQEISPRIQVFASDLPIEKAIEDLNENRNKEQSSEFSEIELGELKAYQSRATDPEIIFTHTLIGDEKGSYLVEVFTIEKENEALVTAYDKLLKSFRLIR